MIMMANPDTKELQLETNAWEETTRDKTLRQKPYDPSTHTLRESDKGKGRIIYKGIRQATSRASSRNCGQKRKETSVLGTRKNKGSDRKKIKSNDSETEKVSWKELERTKILAPASTVSRIRSSHHIDIF